MGRKVDRFRRPNFTVLAFFETASLYLCEGFKEHSKCFLIKIGRNIHLRSRKLPKCVLAEL